MKLFVFELAGVVQTEKPLSCVKGLTKDPKGNMVINQYDMPVHTFIASKDGQAFPIFFTSSDDLFNEMIKFYQNKITSLEGKLAEATETMNQANEIIENQEAIIKKQGEITKTIKDLSIFEFIAIKILNKGGRYGF